MSLLQRTGTYLVYTKDSYTPDMFPLLCLYIVDIYIYIYTLQAEAVQSHTHD
jgi:hypothetical protein